MGFIDKSLVRCAPLITLSCIDEQYRAHPASRVEEESIICDLANLFTSITFHDSDSRSRTPTTLVLSNNSRSSTSSSSQAISKQLTVGTTSDLIRSLFSSILLSRVILNHKSLAASKGNSISIQIILHIKRIRFGGHGNLSLKIVTSGHFSVSFALFDFAN